MGGKMTRFGRVGSGNAAAGKIGTQQRNKDRLGSTSGPMGPEDQRKDKFGSVHNRDALGLLSAGTQQKREELSRVRRTLKGRRRHRCGSRAN